MVSIEYELNSGIEKPRAMGRNHKEANMPSIEVEIEIFCKDCGEGLCNNTDAGRTRGRGQPFFEVRPCGNCIKSAQKESYSKGYDEGYASGVNDSETKK